MTARTNVFALTLALNVVSAGAVALEIDPSAFPAGTDVSNAFPGVTLAAAKGSCNVDDTASFFIEPLELISDEAGPILSDGSFFARSDGANTWASDRDGAGGFQGDDVIRIDFTDVVTRVDVLYVPNDADTGVLAIFDASGNQLDEVLLRSDVPFVLSLSSDTEIAYALVSGADPLRIRKIVTNGSVNLGGSVVGMHPGSVLCRNFATGQSLVIPLGGTPSWDCEAAGLIVSPGDRVQMLVTGRGN